MKPTRANLRPLKRPLLLLCAAIAIFGGVLGASDYLAERLHSRHAQSLERRNASQSQLAKARNDLQEIRAYLQSYQALAQKGYIGDEQRLDWVETLTDLSRAGGIDNARYEFSAQQPVAGVEDQLGDLSLRQSTLRLDLSLMHEEELLRFLQALGEKAHGGYFLDHCRLTRLETGAAGQGLPRNITAACELSWLTFQAGGEAPAPDANGSDGVN
jgi:hypothetical protein